MKITSLAAPFLLCLAAFAQDSVASLEGEVHDASGGGIAGAPAAITNLDTGYKQRQTTSGEGFYRLSLVPVGRYQLAVEQPGFARFQQQPAQLNVGQTVRIEVVLRLASQQESVTVEADATLVDTATNTLGKVVTVPLAIFASAAMTSTVAAS
ncbi:MAG: carboxypeptidase-like regulatory domain-containing protein [Bryobacteraceae bacterium]